MKRSDLLKQTQRTLVARRDALRRALAGDTASLHSYGGERIGDEIDAAIATEQAELNSQMAGFESRELAQIETALDKIKSGTYGRCDVCGRSIAPVRLRALPYASECIACARHDERRDAALRPAASHSPVNRIKAHLDDEVLDGSYEEIG